MQPEPASGFCAPASSRHSINPQSGCSIAGPLGVGDFQDMFETFLFVRRQCASDRRNGAFQLGLFKLSWSVWRLANQDAMGLSVYRLFGPLASILAVMNTRLTLPNIFGWCAWPYIAPSAFVASDVRFKRYRRCSQGQVIAVPIAGYGRAALLGGGACEMSDALMELLEMLLRS